jgi:polysaccharide export outer membrane protein
MWVVMAVKANVTAQAGGVTCRIGIMEVSVFGLRRKDQFWIGLFFGSMAVLVSGSTVAQGVGDTGYQLRPGDVVAVSVWQEPGLEQLVLVRPDGGISFPLAGDLPAEGLTVEQLAANIRKKLVRFIPDPVVTVTLQEIPGNRIYVLGRVNNPGDFPIISRDVTVMQALSLAGGLTPFAKEREIRVLRQVDGKEQAFPFDYRRAARGEGSDQAIMLQPGDVVIVP